ncbi:hypothetical protein DL96DRAFT_904757 [Flagelloscypha sp. PMI_526]|nr:hypothetical protein DL96DRAFT_904757 [Flagelloscypha sp. PMI_526]
MPHELQHVNYPQFMSQSYPSIPLHDYSQLHPSRSASYPPTHTLDNTVTPGQLNLAGGYASGSATAEDEMDTDYDPLDGLIQQLKRELNLPPSMLLSLESIVDPGPGQKPSPQYMVLVQVAILSSPRQRLTLQEIYRALQDRFHYFRERNQPKEPWKESIRHMLTLKKAFKLERRELNEPGKGSYWTLSFEEGDTRIRHRKDKTNRARFLGRPLHDNLGDNADSDTEGPSTPSGSNRPTRSRHTQHSLSSLSVDVRSRSPAASDSGSSYINSPVSAPASISGSIGPYRNTGSSRRRPDNH